MDSLSASSYVDKFSNQVGTYIKNPTEPAEMLLSRTLSLIESSEDFKGLSGDTVHFCQFYLHLYKLLNHLDVRSELLWSCVSVLKTASKNRETRELLIHKYKFVVVLSQFVSFNLLSNQKITQLLCLIETLTFGIRIGWEEPYTLRLTETLVTYIRNDDSNYEHQQMTLSILINVCGDQISGKYLLEKVSDADSLIKKVEQYGIFAQAILLVFDIGKDGFEKLEIYNFIIICFNEMQKAISTWNVSILRHIASFLTRIESRNAYKPIINGYDFMPQVSKLLENLDSRLRMDDTADQVEDDTAVNRLAFHAILFKILHCIMSSGSSLKPIHTQIAALALQFLCEDECCTDASNLLQLIVAEEQMDIERVMPNLRTVLQEMVDTATSTGQKTALIRLINTLLKVPLMHSFILGMCDEAFFEKKLLTRLTQSVTTSLSFLDFTLLEITLYVHTLDTLLRFATISTDTWADKVTFMFKQNAIQFVIAKGILSGLEELSELCLHLSKSIVFPQKEIAKFLTLLSVPSSGSKVVEFVNPVLSHSNKRLEMRVDAALARISEAIDNNELSKMPSSDLIVIMEHKSNRLDYIEEQYRQTCAAASAENNQLLHRCEMLSKELLKYQDTIYSQRIENEILEQRKNEIQTVRQTLANTVIQYNTKMESQRTKLRVQSKECEVLRAETEDFRNKLEKGKSRENELQEKCTKLDRKIKSLDEERNELVKSLKMATEEINQKTELLSKAHKENQKNVKMLEEFKTKNLESEKFIKQLEKSLGEKNELILQQEKELNETSELKNTIMKFIKKDKS